MVSICNTIPSNGCLSPGWSAKQSPERYAPLLTNISPRRKVPAAQTEIGIRTTYHRSEGAKAFSALSSRTRRLNVNACFRHLAPCAYPPHRAKPTNLDSACPVNRRKPPRCACFGKGIRITAQAQMRKIPLPVTSLHGKILGCASAKSSAITRG